MSHRFVTIFLFLFLVLHNSEHSLFSRFRNPNEFVAPADSLEPDEVDADTYADLLEEIPELRSHMRRRPTSRDALRMPYLKNNLEQSDEYDMMLNGAAAGDNLSQAVTAAGRSWDVTNMTLESPTDHRTPGNSSDDDSLRLFDDWIHYWKGPRKATCYCCNVHYSYGIPVGSLCHDAWESPDWQARTMARYFRCHCYRNTYHWGYKIEDKWQHSSHHTDDRGLFRGYYGAYIGGCFKRFTDIGKVYTARGCRSNLPKVSSGFANHRFRKLEILLKGQDNACIMSPHASLTPFSRAISLYVRYHVCVCKGKYCNKAMPHPVSVSMSMTPLLLLLYLVL